LCQLRVYGLRVAVAALIVAIVSALAAVVALLYARRLDEKASQAVAAAQQSAAAAVRSADAAELSVPAAQRAAAAAEERAALESARRHDQLTPRFRIWVSSGPRGEPRMDVGRLFVVWLGPPELARLDGLTVTIRDDRPDRAEGLTPEQIAEQIWGPLRFDLLPDGVPMGEYRAADLGGRVAVTGGMLIGEEVPFALTPTWPPRQWSRELSEWQDEVGTVLRLQLEARREGYEPWTLTGAIDVAGESRTVEVP